MEEEKNTIQPEEQIQPSPDTPSHSNIILWAVAALLLIFLTVGSIYLFQLTQLKTPVPATTPPPQVVSTTPPLPTPTPDELAVPTVSDATDLETIEKELDQLNIASPDPDLEELDADASQL